MAKYIDFIAQMDGLDVLQVFNTTDVTLVNSSNGTNKFTIYCGLVMYTYTLSSSTGALEWVDAVNNAILAVPGPGLTHVIAPKNIGRLLNPEITLI